MNKARLLQSGKEMICGLRPVAADPNRIDRQRPIVPYDAIEHSTDLQREIEIVVLKQVPAADHDGIGNRNLLFPLSAKRAQPALQYGANEPPTGARGQSME